MQKVLLSVSPFTLFAACWLASMEMLLRRHPGFALRIGVAACIAGISLATLLTRGFRANTRAERRLCAAGGTVLIGIGIQAFLRNVRAAHFEGYVFVIALAVVLQGLLMLTRLQRRIGRNRREPAASTPAT